MGEHLAKHATSFCRVTAKGRKRNGKKGRERRERERKREKDVSSPGGKCTLGTCAVRAEDLSTIRT